MPQMSKSAILFLSQGWPNEKGLCHYAIERLNEEIRRRERVIRIFPNRESATRLLGALVMEQDEQWSTGKRYLDMTAYWQWRALQPAVGTQEGGSPHTAYRSGSARR
jgi:hypothetical protein